jgi:hypothetical protein
MEISFMVKCLSRKGISTRFKKNMHLRIIKRMEFEKTLLHSRLKGKSYTTSSRPILQGRKAAKAGGCSGAI